MLLPMLAACAAAPDTRPLLEDEPPVAPQGVSHLPRFADIQGFAVSGRVATAHPVGPYQATIRADAGASQYGKPGRPPMPPGAMVVEELSLSEGARPVLYYAMVRRDPGFFPAGGDWEYFVASEDGQLKASGKLPLCARCHGEAPRDHLFEHGPVAASPTLK